METLIQKKQYFYIIATLYKYQREGLNLHELTYLLTTKKLNKMSDLEDKLFKEKQFSQKKKSLKKPRKNIFKTRQRINDCLTILKKYKIVYKEKDTYHLDIHTFYWLLEYENQRRSLESIIKRYEKKYDQIKTKLSNIQDDEIIIEGVKLMRHKGEKLLKRFMKEFENS